MLTSIDIRDKILMQNPLRSSTYIVEWIIKDRDEERKTNKMRDR